MQMMHNIDLNGMVIDNWCRIIGSVSLSVKVVMCMNATLDNLRFDVAYLCIVIQTQVFLMQKTPFRVLFWRGVIFLDRMQHDYTIYSCIEAACKLIYLSRKHVVRPATNFNGAAVSHWSTKNYYHYHIIRERWFYHHHNDEARNHEICDEV